MLPKGLVCGPSLRPYLLLKSCRMVSNRSARSIQLKKFPRGYGHLVGHDARCAGRSAIGMFSALSMKSEIAGDCLVLASHPGTYQIITY